MLINDDGKLMGKKAIFYINFLIAAVFMGCVNKSAMVNVPPTAKPVCECAGTKTGESSVNSSPIQVISKNAAAKTVESKSAPFKAETKIADYGLLKPVLWEDIDGLRQDFYNSPSLPANVINPNSLSLAWPAWMQSCMVLINKAMWQKACNAAMILSKQAGNKPSEEAVLNFFKQHFSVYKTVNVDGSDTGMITGYYEPILKGSLTKSAKYPYPLYRTPTDLITVEMEDLYPDLKYKRVRGKLMGNKLVPYYNRAEIETEISPIKDHAFIYIDNIIDVFFLHIQGSGLVQLENGEQMHVGYSDQNGQPYNSVGRLLIERGELTASNASMQGIKDWARNHPAKLRDLLNSNPSYVFFRELPADLPGPIGALGVPISSEHTVAVDPKYVPLGAPIFLSTTEPNTLKPLKRLMLAQDAGGAIKGGVRADFYWGTGNEAGVKAGAMKQSGKIWVLLPKEFVITK